MFNTPGDSSTLDLPKVSVITVSYNSASTIRDTIESVIKQSYSNIEFIIIDGGSTDGTLGIIKEYEKDIDEWISEPDDGLYFAMNKGIQKATGEIIGILNSDDWYPHNAIELVVQASIANNKADFIRGNVIFTDEDKTEKYLTIASEKSMAHPTMFVRKNVYLKYGLFNTSYRIVADGELISRTKGLCRHIYVHEVLYYMRNSGISSTQFYSMGIESFKHRKQQGCFLVWNYIRTSRDIVIPYIRFYLERSGFENIIMKYRKIRYKQLMYLDKESKENIEVSRKK